MDDLGGTELIGITPSPRWTVVHVKVWSDCFRQWIDMDNIPAEMDPVVYVPFLPSLL